MRLLACVVWSTLPITMWSVSCAPTAADDPGMASPVAHVDDCTTALGGIDISNTPEGAPGYDDALAAFDFDALPSSLSLAGADDAQRATIAYALEVSPSALSTSLDTRSLLGAGDMGRAIAAGFPGGILDFTFLRRGFHRYYSCSRGYFPATLAGFNAEMVDLADPTVVSRRVIAHSQPKNGERVILEDVDTGVFAAETTDVDGGVRETEIMLSGRRADGFLDFLVYDRDGRLIEGSTFATAIGGESAASAPLSCMACHTDGARGYAFDIIDPTP